MKELIGNIEREGTIINIHSFDIDVIIQMIRKNMPYDHFIVYCSDEMLNEVKKYLAELDFESKGYVGHFKSTETNQVNPFSYIPDISFMRGGIVFNFVYKEFVESNIMMPARTEARIRDCAVINLG